MRVGLLKEIPADQLDGLFREEIEWWNNDLAWDLSPTLQLLKKYLATRSLPGFVLLNATGNPVGYAYYVIDRPLGFVGNIYIRNEYANFENYRKLVSTVVQALTQASHVSRIESQIFGFNYDLMPILTSLGFKCLKRFFLMAPLMVSEGGVNSAEDASFKIVGWEDAFLVPGADTIHDSYVASPDLELCQDYRTNNGCLRFVRNLIENPACGKFDRGLTQVAVDLQGRVMGLLLASRIRQDVGMVPQISVRRETQGRGLGSNLLYAYMDQARRKGLTQVALSVSEANQRALKLYQRLGFRTQKEFYAYVWERSG
jgi:GNAT superfamily N-acetyltransferase